MILSMEKTLAELTLSDGSLLVITHRDLPEIQNKQTQINTKRESERVKFRLALFEYLEKGGPRKIKDCNRFLEKLGVGKKAAQRIKDDLGVEYRRQPGKTYWLIGTPHSIDLDYEEKEN
jgi:hypothetical protein